APQLRLAQAHRHPRLARAALHRVRGVRRRGRPRVARRQRRTARAVRRRNRGRARAGRRARCDATPRAHRLIYARRMALIGNLIWFLLGGFWMALGWWFAGLLMLVSIVGIPWARACFVFGGFCLFPFGREAIDRAELTGRSDIGTGALGT